MEIDPVDFIRTQTQVICPSILPEIKLHMATEVTPLWKLTEEALRGDSLPPPFWAFAWPGGQGVARFLLDHPEVVKGKRVVDMAAGSGVVAIAAMKRGAKSALAVDIDRLAIEAIKLNAELNEVEVKTCEGIDLSRPFKQADVILAGDVFYEQMMSASFNRWMRLCVEIGKDVYVGDPGRAYVPHEGLIRLGSYDVPTSRDLEDRDMRTVTIWRMEKASDGEVES